MLDKFVGMINVKTELLGIFSHTVYFYYLCLEAAFSQLTCLRPIGFPIMALIVLLSGYCFFSNNI